MQEKDQYTGGRKAGRQAGRTKSKPREEQDKSKNTSIILGISHFSTLLETTICVLWSGLVCAGLGLAVLPSSSVVPVLRCSLVSTSSCRVF